MPRRLRIARGLRRFCAAIRELGRHAPPVCIISVAGTSSLLWSWDVVAYRVCMGKQLGGMTILKPSLAGKVVSKRSRACVIVQEVMSNFVYNKYRKSLDYFNYIFVFTNINNINCLR